ncbi:TlpA family protein disulfide reductase, partial [Bacteroidota bacterium]
EKIRMEDYVNEIMDLYDKMDILDRKEQEVINQRADSLWEEDFLNQMEFIKDYPESPVSIFLFLYIYPRLSIEELGSILSKFPPQIQQTSIYNYISKGYKNQLAIKNYTPALNFYNEIEMINVDFKDTSIFQTLVNLNPNKVLYIDMWGVWCGPCMKEFPYSRKLYEKLETNNISFIYLCFNSKEDEWKNMIESEQLNGQHFLINVDLEKKIHNEIGEYRGIPRYIIINADGIIVNNDAPSPSSKTIEELLKLLSH